MGDAVSSSPPCLCPAAMPATRRITRKAGPNHGRPFWACAATDGRSCKFFQWAGAAPASLGAPVVSPASLPDRIDGQCASCRAPVAHQTVAATNQKGNAGRRFYQCGGCGKFVWLTPPPAAIVPAAPERVGLRYFVVDERSRARLQDLFTVPAGVQLGVGRDYAGGGPEDYDDLRVVDAWRILNPEKRERYQAFVACVGAQQPSAAGTSGVTPVPLRAAHAQAATALLQSARLEPLAEGVNEALLLHGTKPEHLHSLLFEGLDPHLASEGLFGKGPTRTRYNRYSRYGRYSLFGKGPTRTRTARSRSTCRTAYCSLHSHTATQHLPQPIAVCGSGRSTSRSVRSMRYAPPCRLLLRGGRGQSGPVRDVRPRRCARGRDVAAARAAPQAVREQPTWPRRLRLLRPRLPRAARR